VVGLSVCGWFLAAHLNAEYGLFSPAEKKMHGQASYLFCVHVIGGIRYETSNNQAFDVHVRQPL
jgi:hypothetical protein